VVDEPRRDRLQTIKDALGPERTVGFMELMMRLDIAPDADELVLAACVASFVVDLREFRKWATDEREAFEKAFARSTASIGGSIAEAFTRGGDDFQTELRLAARDVAQSEYRAAAALRSDAIAGEVQSLSAAAQALAREREANTVARIAGRDGGAVAAPASQGGTLLGIEWSPRIFGVVAIAFLVGWAACLFLTHGAVRR
jgi:hypothetical protein